MHIGFPCVVKYKAIALSGLDRRTQNLNPCFITAKKIKKNKASVILLKDTTGICFPFCSCVCPLIFFVPQAEQATPN